MCRYTYRHKHTYTHTQIHVCVRKAFTVGPANRMREYQDLTPASWHSIVKMRTTGLIQMLRIGGDTVAMSIALPIVSFLS